jgi:RHS repeat-associated protein
MAGQYYDSESGVFYNISRSYSPAIGRFVSGDRIGLAGGLNTYGYAAQNPVNAIDPFGFRSTVSSDGSMILIAPEEEGVPPVTIPLVSQLKGVQGVSSGANSSYFYGIPTFHSYDLGTYAACGNLSGVSAGLVNLPTPGPNNQAAKANGQLNNVGPLGVGPFIISDYNDVMSFVVKSPNPATMTDIVVNYTIPGSHLVSEGFVLRWGELGPGGRITLRSYGEGNSGWMAPILEAGWGPIADDLWHQNQQTIFAGCGCGQ